MPRLECKIIYEDGVISFNGEGSETMARIIDRRFEDAEIRGRTNFLNQCADAIRKFAQK